jgi:hypothetical protein
MELNNRSKEYFFGVFFNLRNLQRDDQSLRLHAGEQRTSISSTKYTTLKITEIQPSKNLQRDDTIVDSKKVQ